ncbi:MAG: hypothetical protein IJG23_04210 [Clostridia bacterium]|nr:hypothetical protein [Clostridia bacterium]
MNEKILPYRVSLGKQDNTVYLIEYAVGENAKENAYEKLKRMILNEPIIVEKQSS